MRVRTYDSGNGSITTAIMLTAHIPVPFGAREKDVCDYNTGQVVRTNTFTTDPWEIRHFGALGEALASKSVKYFRIPSDIAERITISHPSFLDNLRGKMISILHHYGDMYGSRKHSIRAKMDDPQDNYSLLEIFTTEFNLAHPLAMEVAAFLLFDILTNPDTRKVTRTFYQAQRILEKLIATVGDSVIDYEISGIRRGAVLSKKSNYSLTVYTINDETRGAISSWMKPSVDKLYYGCIASPDMTEEERLTAFIDLGGSSQDPTIAPNAVSSSTSQSPAIANSQGTSMPATTPVPTQTPVYSGNSAEAIRIPGQNQNDPIIVKIPYGLSSAVDHRSATYVSSVKDYIFSIDNISALTRNKHMLWSSVKDTTRTVELWDMIADNVDITEPNMFKLVVWLLAEMTLPEDKNQLTSMFHIKNRGMRKLAAKVGNFVCEFKDSREYNRVFEWKYCNITQMYTITRLSEAMMDALVNFPSSTPWDLFACAHASPTLGPVDIKKLHDQYHKSAPAPGPVNRTLGGSATRAVQSTNSMSTQTVPRTTSMSTQTVPLTTSMSTQTVPLTTSMSTQAGNAPKQPTIHMTPAQFFANRHNNQAPRRRW